MSRVERKQQKHVKKNNKIRKLKVVFKMFFISFMMMSVVVSIYIVDKNAKSIMGYETYDINHFINEIADNINEKYSEINKYIKEYKK